MLPEAKLSLPSTISSRIASEISTFSDSSIELEAFWKGRVELKFDFSLLKANQIVDNFQKLLIYKYKQIFD